MPRDLWSGVSAAVEASGAVGRVGVQGARAAVRCHQTIQAGNSLKPGEVRAVPPALRGQGMAFPGGGKSKTASSSKGCGCGKGSNSMEKKRGKVNPKQLCEHA